MAQYPDLPDNRLIVNGQDICASYGLIMLDGYKLEPPEVKTYTVDIPGSDGSLDLTEALNGDVNYGSRKQEFTFALIDPGNFERTKTLISNQLHGRAFDYKITMDPEYTYHGRFSISSYTQPSGNDAYGGRVANIVISIEADPYKLRQHMTYKVNAVGGRMYKFYSGRKLVRPIVETRRPVHIEWNGQNIDLGIGTFRLNTVLFSEGANSIYINSLELFTVTWDWIQEEAHKMTWDEAGSKYRWDELQRLGLGDIDAEITAQSWDDFLPDWNSDANISPYIIYGYNDGTVLDSDQMYYDPTSGTFVAKNSSWGGTNASDSYTNFSRTYIEQHLADFIGGRMPLPNTPAAKYLFSQLYQNYQSDLSARSQKGATWDDMAERTWDSFVYTGSVTDSSESQNIVYITYDWKDL